MFIKNPDDSFLISNLEDPMFYTLLNQYPVNVVDFDLDLLKTENTLENIEIKMNRESKKPKVMFLSNPNFASGKNFEKEEINSILEFCYSKNIMLIIDESFLLTSKQSNSFLKQLKSHPNIDLRNNFEMITCFDSRKTIFPISHCQGSFSIQSNLDPIVKDMFVKFKSMMISSSSQSQINVELQHNLFYEPCFLSEDTFKIHQNEIKNNQMFIENNFNDLKEILLDFPNFKLFPSNRGLNVLSKIDFPEKLKVKYGDRADAELSKHIKDNSGVNTIPGSFLHNPNHLIFSKFEQFQDKNEILKDIIKNFN